VTDAIVYGPILVICGSSGSGSSSSSWWYAVWYSRMRSYWVCCSQRLWVKSGSAEVRGAGVTTGKKREIKREVSRFLPGYDIID